MNAQGLKKLLDVAAGRCPADLVIRHANIVDVYNQQLLAGDLAIVDGLIAGIGGSYTGTEYYDAKGQYAAPGLIEGHIHIESSYLTPEEFGRLIVPLGTTTIIADPHEIVNVCGLEGLSYMRQAAANTALEVKFMLPSCVPATEFEHSGARLNAAAMQEPLQEDDVLGLGEFMDFPSVIAGRTEAIEKLLSAHNAHKLIDGHSPGLLGQDLNAYVAAGIHTDHECSTLPEMQERLARGMYVLLRNGSACHNLLSLLPGVTPANLRRCVLCSDDLHPKTILDRGHLNASLRTCVEQGLEPLAALTMATLNAAECFHLSDRGALAPGLRADITLWSDLKSFQAPTATWIAGQRVSQNGAYLPTLTKAPITKVASSVHLESFQPEQLQLKLKTTKVRTIDLLPGEIVTEAGCAEITLDEQGDFCYTPTQDIVKLAVLERHHNTGKVGLGLLRGYGLQRGAVGVSVAHDSHNLIIAGTNNADMAAAAAALAQLGGGIVLINEGKLLASLPLPIAGLMSDQDGASVEQCLQDIHAKAHSLLGISEGVDPIMTLCFMSLPVIPALKLTDMGLFDVNKFAFTTLEYTE